jgi:hypothetical protein
MTAVEEWEKCKKNNTAYFPREFDADEYTHATSVPARLVETANHFYQEIAGDWVCLEFSRKKLREEFGIITKDEAPGAVRNLLTEINL